MTAKFSRTSALTRICHTKGPAAHSHALPYSEDLETACETERETDRDRDRRKSASRTEKKGGGSYKKIEEEGRGREENRTSKV